ncbi:RHS repeat domain-containing protein [Aquimarina longa]|uniref:RHS repeat domain-containing protein n=1 Tax=Aquimarina longa TaxID=1080221 RepID=UPI0011DFFBEE|nr:RHS repeat domain-containing protein [Aquimarina longa]
MKNILRLLFLFCYSMGAQEVSTEHLKYHHNYTPVTPNASNFLIYGNTPVNHATGIPQINIPLFTIEEDGISVPISLSYHASGVKVDDLASAVGLKWTLNAGGGIFRQVNDKPDEAGWLLPASRDYVTSDWVRENPVTSQNAQRDLSVSALTHDYNPDDFNYSFLGNSGSFIFNRDGTVGLEQKSQMYIQKIQGVGQLIDFMAKDATGNTFYFNNVKESNSKNVINGGGFDLSFNRETSITGWMIDHITTKNDKQITFKYLPYQFEYTLANTSHSISHSEKCNVKKLTQPSHTIPVKTGSCGCEGETTAQVPVYNTALLRTSIIQKPINQLIKNIESDRIKVTFNYADDNSLSEWKKKLISIDILDKIKGKKKSFRFTYGKFSGDPRLRLDAVQEIGFDGTVKPPHQFEYIAGDLPKKGSMAKDLQGYYNGNNNNETLIPFSMPAYTKLTTRYLEQLGNRTVDIDYLKRGILNKIIYPTGGSTIFEYDGNSEITTRVDFPTLVKYPPVSVIPTTNDVSEYGQSVFTQEFTITENATSDGTLVTHTTESNACEYDDNNPSIDCSRWNIYKKLSDGSLSSSVFDSPRVIGPEKGEIMLKKGTYVLELVVKNNILITKPTIRVSVRWDRVETKKTTTPRKVYTGGIHIKTITDRDEHKKIAKKTTYTYDGITRNIPRINDYIKEYGVKMVFSSNDIKSNLITKKSGYFFKKVTIEASGADGPLKTIEYFSRRHRNRSYESVMTRQEIYKDNTIVKTTDMDYINEIESRTYFWTLTDKDECVFNPYTTTNNIGVYLGYGTPESSYYTHTKNVLSKRTEISYFNKENEPINALVSINRYQYNNTMQVIKEEIDGRYYVKNKEDLANKNFTMYPDGNHSEIRYTYPNNHSSENATIATLANNYQIALPISKKVYTNGTFIQGQYVDYDIKGNVIATYRHHKGKAVNQSSKGHIPSNYELYQQYKIEEGKPVEMQRKDGIPTSILWDSTKNYILAQLIGVTKTQLNEVTRSIDLKITTDDQLRTLYNRLRTTFSKSQITTYIHDPLKGMVEMTDARGYTSKYSYDGLGRLSQVKDQDNSLISENKYHYKNQN